MGERGVLVDHATVHRWSIKILPVLAAVFRRFKRPVGASWRMDETYIKVAGQWKYLYRAVDRDGETIDLLLVPSEITQPHDAFSSRPSVCTVSPKRSPLIKAVPTRPLNLLGLPARRFPKQSSGIAHPHRHAIRIVASRPMGRRTHQSFAERRKPALEHGADGIGRAATDL